MTGEGSPFRQELQAAHERIAQLERENAELVAKCRRLEAKRGALPARTRKTHAIAVALAMASMLCVLGMVLFGIVHVRHVSRVSDPSEEHSYRGVAVASPSGSVRTPPAVPPAPKGVRSVKPCNCAPGDPLCSCL